MSASTRPSLHLATLAREYPNIWKLIDEFRSERGKSLPRWADWCFVPLAATYAIASGGGDNRVPLSRITDVARIGALASWRPTQGIYRFDPTIMDAVWDTPLTGKLPVELLFWMPEWCVYVELPDLTFMGTRAYGFFAHLEDDQNEPEHYELRLLLDTDTGFQAIPIHLAYGSTIESGLSQTITEAERNQARGLVPEGIPNVTYPPGFADAISPLISLVLYLCSEEPDLQANGRRISPTRPARPRPRKTKSGWRLFPPNKPTTWEVGSQVGAALRRAYDTEREPLGGTHASPRAHIRRGHWHSFWIGPRNDESKRRLILKWLHPMVVGTR